MSNFDKMGKIGSMSKVRLMNVAGYPAMTYTEEGMRTMRFSTEEDIKVQVKFAVDPYLAPGELLRTHITAFHGKDYYVDVCFHDENLEANVKVVIQAVRSLICLQTK
jgi:hypothetical protein